MKVGISAGTANSLLGPLLPFFMQCIKNPPQAAACGGVVGVWRFELQASWSRTKRATICAIPRKKTAAHRLPLWLRKKDSNPHNTSQSRRCYHYTIPHHALVWGRRDAGVRVLYYYTKKAAPCQPLFQKNSCARKLPHSQAGFSCACNSHCFPLQ